MVPGVVRQCCTKRILGLHFLDSTHPGPKARRAAAGVGREAVAAVAAEAAAGILVVLAEAAVDKYVLAAAVVAVAVAAAVSFVFLVRCLLI